MTGFFSPMGRHGAIPISSITEVSPTQKREGRSDTCLVRFKRPDRTIGALEVHAFEGDELCKRVIQIIPAEPGARLLSPGIDDEGFYCGKTALIAWALCIDGEVRPLTPVGLYDGNDEVTKFGWWVQLPSGGIFETSMDAATVEDMAELESVVTKRHEWEQKESSKALESSEEAA